MARMKTHLDRFDPSDTYVARKPIQLPRDVTIKRGEIVPEGLIGGIVLRRLYAAREVMSADDYRTAMNEEPRPMGEPKAKTPPPKPAVKTTKAAEQEEDF